MHQTWGTPAKPLSDAIFTWEFFLNEKLFQVGGWCRAENHTRKSYLLRENVDSKRTNL